MISTTLSESFGPLTDTNARAELIYWRLLESSAYHVYQRAFVDSTGLPLVLESRRPGAAVERAEHESPFCQLVNQSDPFSCARCQMSNMRLEERCPKGTVSGDCKAGLTYLVAPVRLGAEPVAYLLAGQFLKALPSKPEVSARALRWLRQEPGLARQLEHLVPAFQRTSVVCPPKMERSGTLLEIFAELLSGCINSLLIEDRPCETAPISMARSLVRAKPGEAISSAEAASRTGLSEATFNRRFEQSLGISFQEYVTRCRLEHSRRLLTRNSSVNWRQAVALAGCQSLAEFNEQFLTMFGESPRQHRERILANRQRLAQVS